MKFLWQSLFNSQLESMTDSGSDNRLRRVEQKVNILLAVAVFQSGMLCFLFASQLVPSTSTLAILAILAIVGVIMLNKLMPGWTRVVRRIFSALFGRSNSANASAAKTDGMKEDF